MKRNVLFQLEPPLVCLLSLLAPPPATVLYNTDKTASHGGLYERFAEELVMLEVGMAAENAMLQSVALELAATPIGAFEEADLKSLLPIEKVGHRNRL